MLRDGAIPMASDEGGDIFEKTHDEAYLFWDFGLPILIVFGTVIISYAIFDSWMILEAFIMAVIYLGSSHYTKNM